MLGLMIGNGICMLFYSCIANFCFTRKRISAIASSYM